MTWSIGLGCSIVVLSGTLCGCALPLAVSSEQITPDLGSRRLALDSPNYQAFCVNDGKSSHLVSFGYGVALPAKTVAAALVGGLSSAGALSASGSCKYSVSATVTALQNDFVNMPFAPLPITSVVAYTMVSSADPENPQHRLITDHFRQPYIFEIPLDVATAETVHAAIRNSIQDNLGRYIESLIHSPESKPVS
jgi:hypothetical protein